MHPDTKAALDDLILFKKFTLFIDELGKTNIDKKLFFMLHIILTVITTTFIMIYITNDILELLKLFKLTA